MIGMWVVNKFRSTDPPTIGSLDVDYSVDSAWKIHQALTDWTARVDLKASFALTLESGVLGAIVAASSKGIPFGHISSPVALTLFWAGVGFLILAILAAVYVVSPRIRVFYVRSEWRSNYIYFGHLRFWDPDELENKLRESNPLPVLARQLVNMAKIAWKKHLLVQVSFSFAIAGSALAATSAFLHI